MLLADGTVVGSISNAFEDEPDGFTAHLSVTLPASCTPVVIEQHLEHFAVEFRTWILRAASELSGDRTGASVLAPTPKPFHVSMGRRDERPDGSPSRRGILVSGRGSCETAIRFRTG